MQKKVLKKIDSYSILRVPVAVIMSGFKKVLLLFFFCCMYANVFSSELANHMLDAQQWHKTMTIPSKTEDLKTTFKNEKDGPLNFMYGKLEHCHLNDEHRCEYFAFDHSFSH